jgi:hypothetical protein
MKRELLCRQVFDIEDLNSLFDCIDNEAVG